MFFERKVYVFMIFLCFIQTSQGFSLSLKEILKELKPAQVLEPFKELQCCPEGKREFPVIYCYKASGRSLENLWSTAEVLISLNPEQYELYWGYNEVDVVTQYLSELSILKFNVFFWRQKDIKLNPFNDTCFGIVTSHDYDLRLVEEKFNPLRLWLFLGGITLFFVAENLAPDPFFFYITGIIGGVLLSFAILFYFLLALMPAKKTTIAAIMAGGGGVLFLMMDWILTILRTLVIKYQMFVTGYIVTSAIISFFVCYRYGPVTNPQSINIIKWCLQGAGAVTMWASSDHQEAVLVMIGLMVLFYYVPVIQLSYKFLYLVVYCPINLVLVGSYQFSRKYILKTIGYLVRTLHGWIFGIHPPPLLTMAQYKEQGRVETGRALGQLQESFRSGQIDAFETLSHLSPQSRDPFIKFMTNQQGHVSQEEIDEHAASFGEGEDVYTDDED